MVFPLTSRADQTVRRPRHCLFFGNDPVAAIIAATAMAHGIPLVTRNDDDFKHIPGLDLRNPFEIEP